MTSLAATKGISSTDRGPVLRALVLGLALAAGGLALGLLAGELVAKGKPQDVVGLAVVLLPVALWRRPQLGPVVLISAALLIEQVAVTAEPDSMAAPGALQVPVYAPITGHIPLFAGLGSLHLDPSDLLLLMIAVIYLVRTDATARDWPRSYLAKAMGALMGALLLGLMIGVAHHGSIREALNQVRPFVYLASSYVLTAVLIRTRSAVRSVLWAFVVATGIKAAQGVAYFITTASHLNPRPDSVIGHEVAYFFAVFVLLVTALWLFQVPGRLRTTATWLLPVVIAANLVNQRRAAWLLLGGGLIALAAIGYVCLPNRRPALRKAGIAVLAISVVYFPLYWNKDGAIAGPAVAIRSQFSPNSRDAASDLYRVEENANLKFNIKLGGVLGRGLGVPIDYALPIYNLRTETPSLAYVPHNDVLYILMDLGFLGAIAFWAVLGTAMIAGCRLAKSVDRELAVVGAVVTSSLVAYALEGATDVGFAFYRIAFVTGVLLGLLEAARRLRRPTDSSQLGAA